MVSLFREVATILCTNTQTSYKKMQQNMVVVVVLATVLATVLARPNESFRFSIQTLLRLHVLRIRKREKGKGDVVMMKKIEEKQKTHHFFSWFVLLIIETNILYCIVVVNKHISKSNRFSFNVIL